MEYRETRSGKQYAYGYRFYPDKLKGEGFFIAAFRKEAQGNCDHINRANLQSKNKNKTNRAAANEMACIRPFLKDASRFFFTRQNDEILAIPVEFENDLPVLQSALYIKKAGVNLGSIIRNELIPHHELSVSTIIGESIKRIEVDQATALDYLRRSVLKIESMTKGWHLITHAQLPLGWVKMIPGRINNNYPANWRILNK